MAIQVQTAGQTDLRIASPQTKRNFATALTGGPFSSDVVGHWRAFFVRVPGGYTTLNQRFAMMGWDTGGTGSFASTQDWVIRIPGDTASVSQRRLQLQDNSTSSAFAGTEGNLSAMPQFTISPSLVPALVVMGVTNIGTNGSPIWRTWAAVCNVGGGVIHTYVAPTVTAAGFITSVTQRIFHQVFVRQSTVRTPPEIAMEEVIYCTGDFPWDTVTNPSSGATGVGRPHHDALLALAGGGSNPLLTYEDLISAQNAGTLPYADCRQGKGRAEYRFTLRNLTDGLVNSGAISGNLAEDGTPGGLSDVSSIAPTHWLGGAPTVIEPEIKFIGGRGALAYTVSGTYQGGTTALERRWIYGAGNVNGQTAGTALPGLDWANISGIVGGDWSRADTLPVGGPYELQVRDTNTPAFSTTSSDWLVGTKALVGHGQSSMDQVSTGEGGDGPLGNNRLSIAVDAGARGVLVRYENARGSNDSGATYAQPQIMVGQMVAGATPAVAHGIVAMLNQWNAINPAHPLLIANFAIGGTAMSDWANNTTVSLGHSSWQFMGTIGNTPNPSSGNNSGVVEFMAQRLGRQIDCHGLMWTPGISDDATGAGSRALYVQEVDARFSNSPNAPWLIFPVWRVARPSTEISGSPTRRMRHLDMVTELGTRGIQGPCWLDPVMVGWIGHSAYTNGNNVVAGQPGDQNQVGQAKLGRGIGRALAWAFNRRAKAHGGRLVAAYYGDGTRNTIEIELGRQHRTLNGTTASNQFWISTDNGGTWSQSGFTFALARNNTCAILTTTGAAFPATNVRVEYAWNFPFSGDSPGDELNAEANLQTLLYDNQTHRGNTNLSAGDRAGTPLQGINRSGAGVAGLPVATKGAAKLNTTERFTGSRLVTARLMASDGVTVLAEKSLAITAS